MSAFRAAPTGVFELQRSSSFQTIKAPAPKYAPGQTQKRASSADTREREFDYEDEEVDETVREDMTKLEDTFPGISERFRLVNRIGEGMSCRMFFFSYLPMS